MLRVINSQDGNAQTLEHTQNMLPKVRITAEPVIIVRHSPAKPLAEIIAEHSQATDLTLLGMQVPDANRVESYSQYMDKLTHAIGPVPRVRSTQTEDLLDTE